VIVICQPFRFFLQTGIRLLFYGFVHSRRIASLHQKVWVRDTWSTKKGKNSVQDFQSIPPKKQKFAGLLVGGVCVRSGVT